MRPIKIAAKLREKETVKEHTVAAELDISAHAT